MSKPWSDKSELELKFEQLQLKYDSAIAERDGLMEIINSFDATMEHLNGVHKQVVAERNELRWEYENVCKFATQYERERGELRERLLAYEHTPIEMGGTIPNAKVDAVLKERDQALALLREARDVLTAYTYDVECERSNDDVENALKQIDESGVLK